jgi:hypothetical protein
MEVPFVRWELLALPGNTLALVDEKKLEVFSFHEGGTITASVGIKGEAQTRPFLFGRFTRKH